MNVILTLAPSQSSMLSASRAFCQVFIEVTSSELYSLLSIGLSRQATSHTPCKLRQIIRAH